MGEIERIDKILKNVLNGIGIEFEKNRNLDISVVWPRILDEKIRGKSYVLFDKNGYLYVKVESSCCLSWLRINKKQIINKLKEMGFKYKDIKFLI
ncbi:MAG: DUF721 domain-containing protein [Candidatus Omnitrophica bacterium]|nr:DUF721 domain-containing protein [Candidatus Omnitrophota bacterium]